MGGHRSRYQKRSRGMYDMMGHRIPLVSGDEYDALTRGRHYLHWKPGDRRKIKRRYRRRERAVGKRQLDVRTGSWSETI
jgi:hypothetical protein